MNISTKKILFTICITILTLPVTNVLGCTIFTVSNENTTFFGNNEDYYHSNTYIMIRPSTKPDEFGGLFFGFEDLNYQGALYPKHPI